MIKMAELRKTDNLDLFWKLYRVNRDKLYTQIERRVKKLQAAYILTTEREGNC